MESFLEPIPSLQGAVEQEFLGTEGTPHPPSAILTSRAGTAKSAAPLQVYLLASAGCLGSLSFPSRLYLVKPWGGGVSSLIPEAPYFLI